MVYSIHFLLSSPVFHRYGLFLFDRSRHLETLQTLEYDMRNGLRLYASRYRHTEDVFRCLVWLITRYRFDFNGADGPVVFSFRYIILAPVAGFGSREAYLNSGGIETLRLLKYDCRLRYRWA